jgi:hypothetical protein
MADAGKKDETAKVAADTLAARETRETRDPIASNNTPLAADDVTQHLSQHRHIVITNSAIGRGRRRRRLDDRKRQHPIALHQHIQVDKRRTITVKPRPSTPASSPIARKTAAHTTPTRMAVSKSPLVLAEKMSTV